MSYRPKGETTHWIFRSLMLPYKSSSHSASTAVTDSLDFRVADAPLQIQFASASTAVTDSLDFRVADAPLQIQFASAKYVRCASLRSGGRRLAVRKMIECHIPAQTRTPFPASRDFPSRGNERYEGKNSESYTSRTISAFSLFGGCRHHLARWEACHMTQKVNPVTLTIYSSPDRAIPQPSA